MIKFVKRRTANPPHHQHPSCLSISFVSQNSPASAYRANQLREQDAKQEQRKVTHNKENRAVSPQALQQVAVLPPWPVEAVRERVADHDDIERCLFPEPD